MITLSAQHPPQSPKQAQGAHTSCRSEQGVKLEDQSACADRSSCQQQPSAHQLAPAHQDCAGYDRHANDTNHATDSNCEQQSITYICATPNVRSAKAFHNRSQGEPQAEPAGICSAQQQPALSDAAHEQYTYFKVSRQQRLAAAVTLQRYIRGLLARLLVKRLQKLRVHAKRRQQHVLTVATELWRVHAVMRTLFR